MDGRGDRRATMDREREGGAQYFLNSTSSGGLISTVLLPTSVQLVLRTVPPDSICGGEDSEVKLHHVISVVVTQLVLSAFERSGLR